MATIDEIILSSINPFDGKLKATSFWNEEQDLTSTIDSIHADAIAKIEDTLSQVIQERSVKTLLILGDSGSGKTYLLGRIKKKLNNKAFFVYVEPFPKSDHIWRHILRETVNSLLQVPEGQQESQLILWLKSLFKFEKASLKDKLFKIPIQELWQSDKHKSRKEFIKKLQEVFKSSSIFNAEEFFGILYSLNDPDLANLAANWLKGDSLHEDSLKALQVRNLIADEDTAQKILANFGKISAETQPIVLCFDQLESIDRLANDSPDLPKLFTVNTLIHSTFKNFLVLVSCTTNTWQDPNKPSLIQGSDLARIDETLKLAPISSDQIEAIYAMRLHHLHRSASPTPDSSIYPITKEYIKSDIPRGRTHIRTALKVASNIFQSYKQWLASGKPDQFTYPNSTSTISPSVNNLEAKEAKLAAFQLHWDEELQRVRTELKSIHDISTLVLLEMLQTAIRTLEIPRVEPEILKGSKYTSYSFSFFPHKASQAVGVIWSEHSNMTDFFHVMKACEKAAEQGFSLRLIRKSSLGKAANKGHQLYSKIFTGKSHKHLEPDLDSICYLQAYYNLVKDAREGDLSIGSEILQIKELESLARQSQCLANCTLLQQLGIISASSVSKKKPEDNSTQIKEFLFNTLKTQQILGVNALIDKALSQFPDHNLERTQVEQFITELCHNKQIQIMNPNAPAEVRLICLVPTLYPS